MPNKSEIDVEKKDVVNLEDIALSEEKDVADVKTKKDEDIVHNHLMTEGKKTAKKPRRRGKDKKKDGEGEIEVKSTNTQKRRNSKPINSKEKLKKEPKKKREFDMSHFVPKYEYLRGILLHYFIQGKSAAEAHRILVETYGDYALSETTCRDWFRRFKNKEYDCEDRERSGAPKKFKDEELEALIHEGSCQTLTQLAESLGVDHTTVSKRLKVLGMNQEQGHWVP